MPFRLWEFRLVRGQLEFSEFIKCNHLSAVNWSNIMMLGAIGLVFWMANSLGWADTNVAATYSLTLLFLRTPLLSAVGALPTLLSAQVGVGANNMMAILFRVWHIDVIKNMLRTLAVKR